MKTTFFYFECQILNQKAGFHYFSCLSPCPCTLRGWRRRWCPGTGRWCSAPPRPRAAGTGGSRRSSCWPRWTRRSAGCIPSWRREEEFLFSIWSISVISCMICGVLLRWWLLTRFPSLVQRSRSENWAWKCCEKTVPLFFSGDLLSVIDSLLWGWENVWVRFR